MPNQEIMREWVTALRSGNYEQGRGRLRTDNQYCCLGVLCDIAVRNGVIPQGALPIRSSDVEQVIYSYGGFTNFMMPPSTVRVWADLPAGQYIYAGELSATKLAHLNDTGATFAEIADLIEETWIDLPDDVNIPDSPADIPAQETVNA
jgi:hypothetical protein